MACIATPPPASHTRSTESRYSYLYQPPQISQSPGAIEEKADYFSRGTSRKRSRTDTTACDPAQAYSSSHVATYGLRTPSYAQDIGSRNQQFSPSEPEIFSTSSLGHVNDKYLLRDGFDTPGLINTTDFDTLIHADHNARRTMTDQQEQVAYTEPAFSGPLARERNGYARVQRQPDAIYPTYGIQQNERSWARYAMTLPISIASKAFSFGTTVFKGFYAGEGNGYAINSAAASAVHTVQQAGAKLMPGSWKSSPSSSMSQSSRKRLVPGSWNDSPPDHTFLGDFEQDNPSMLRPAPNKRRHTDRDEWVIVGGPDLESPEPATKRMPSAASRPSLRTSRSAARRSQPLSRRSSHINSTGSPLSSSRLTLDTSATRQSLSAYPPTSPRRSGSSASNATAYPSPEAERFAKRQAKQDRAVDRHVSSMSKQVSDLIRQGQEALGTTFSVEGHEDHDFDDDGFFDED